MRLLCLRSCTHHKPALKAVIKENVKGLWAGRVLQAIHLVNPQHEGASASCSSSAVGMGVQLAKGPLPHHCILAVPVKLLGVAQKMFDARGHIVALRASDKGSHSCCAQHLALAIVLPQPAIEGVARQVGARAQHHIGALEKVLQPHCRPKALQQGRVPALRHCEGCGEGSDARHAIPHALRAILQGELWDAQARNGWQRASIGALLAAHAQGQLLRQRHLSHQSLRTQLGRGRPGRGCTGTACQQEKEAS
jgi:hypothetical protein